MADPHGEVLVITRSIPFRIPMENPRWPNGGGEIPSDVNVGKKTHEY